MSDTMLFGVLRMPYELAMSDELSRRQFYDRAQEAADAIERLTAEREGWQWVPVEPTPEILDALRTGSRKDWPSDELCRVRWAAALSAIQEAKP